MNPPANLKGINGIAKFSKEIKKWDKFDDEKLKRAGTTNFFQLNADGGTGGGIFRKMYGRFIIEAAPTIGVSALEAIGQDFVVLADKWDAIAWQMWKLHESSDTTLPGEMSALIIDNHDIEAALLVRLRELFH